MIIILYQHVCLHLNSFDIDDSDVSWFDLNVCATGAWQWALYVQMVYCNVLCSMYNLVLWWSMQVDELDSGEALSLEILKSLIWNELEPIQTEQIQKQI